MTDTIIYEIPSWNVPRLYTEVEKLNKKAAKFGSQPLVLTEHGVILEPDPTYHEALDIGINSYESIPKIKMHRISISGDPIKIAGWTFVGKLDHITFPGHVIVNAVPGQSVPETFFHSEPRCEHCNRIRRRYDTFVLRNNDNNTHIQVGRQCLRDFLGHDPVHVISHLAGIFKLLDELADGDERWYGGRCFEPAYDKMHVLKATSAIIRTFGWTSRAAADPMIGKHATAEHVLFLLGPATNAETAQLKREFAAKIKFDENLDTKNAIGAVEWLEKQPKEGANEYMFNLHTINSNVNVPSSMFGYWCSLMSAYFKAQEKNVINKSQNKISEWVGNEGDKIESVVLVLSKSGIDGYYGHVNCIKMLDNEGRTLMWFASGDSSFLEPGHMYDIKGRVKKHNLYQDWKETILTRVSAKEKTTNEMS